MTFCFLDCGTNLGQGLKFFNKKYELFNNEKWYIYTFEANPFINLNNMFTNVDNITKIPKAIWINDDKIKFTSRGKNTTELRIKYNEGILQGGGSHISITRSDANIPEHVDTSENMVDCISFSNFVESIHNKYEKIIVKMDIEGAEFEIIEDMIKNNTIQYIDTLYMETHGRFKTQNINEANNIESILIEKCKKHINNVIKWY